MARNNTPAQLHKMRQSFLRHDLCGDGKIGHSQLGDCLRVVGANPSEKSIRQHIQMLRASQVERISFDEFLSIYESIVSREAAHQAGSSTIAEQLISGLRLLDQKNTGYLPAKRLRHILTTCGERLTKAEMDELLVDRVNDLGLVNYVEFVHVIINN